VRYTHEVPNSDVIQNLLTLANSGPITHGVMPIGGGYQSYDGYLQVPGPGAKTVVLRTIGAGDWMNHSREAEMLVRFLDRNCLR
jgi:hypothetical protein